MTGFEDLNPKHNQENKDQREVISKWHRCESVSGASYP